MASPESVNTRGWLRHFPPTGYLLQFSRVARDSSLRVNIQNDFANAPELPAYDYRREGVVLDLNCPNSKLILEKASKNRAFIHRYTWLLIHNSTYKLETIQKILSDAAVLPDADVTWCAADDILDIHRLNEHQPYVVMDLGLSVNSTIEDLDAVWSTIPTAATRRRHLNNLTINAVVIVSQPQYFKGWSDLSNRQIDTFPKLTYPMLMHCAEDLRFWFNLKQVDEYGVELNGSFTGTVGLLQRGRAELGVASMFMRSDRWRVLHFSSETVALLNAFMFRAPAQSSVSNIFLLPLSRGVWCCAAALLCGSAVLLAVLSCRLVAADPTLQLLTLPEIFVFSIGTVCQQGFYIMPKLLSIRMIMFLTLLTSLFTFTAYSAKIVAILQTPSAAVRTVADLADSHMDVGIQETTYKKVYYAESTDPSILRLFHRKVAPLGERVYMSVVEGVERMRTGLFAFQVERSSGYEIISKTFTESEKCGLMEIEAFKLPMVAVPLRKHSGYRELFGTRLRWQREVGLMSRVRAIWLAARPRCEGRGVGFRAVRLLDMLPALQMLAAGGLVAVVLLILENVYHHYSRTGNVLRRSTALPSTVVAAVWIP